MNRLLLSSAFPLLLGLFSGCGNATDASDVGDAGSADQRSVLPEVLPTLDACKAKPITAVDVEYVPRTQSLSSNSPLVRFSVTFNPACGKNISLHNLAWVVLGTADNRHCQSWWGAVETISSSGASIILPLGNSRYEAIDLVRASPGTIPAYWANVGAPNYFHPSPLKVEIEKGGATFTLSADTSHLEVGTYLGLKLSLFEISLADGTLVDLIEDPVLVKAGAYYTQVDFK